VGVREGETLQGVEGSRVRFFLDSLEALMWPRNGGNQKEGKVKRREDGRGVEGNGNLQR